MMLAAFRAGRRGSSRSRSSNARKAALESTRRRAPSSPAAASFASRWKAVETFTYVNPPMAAGSSSSSSSASEAAPVMTLCRACCASNQGAGPRASPPGPAP